MYLQRFSLTSINPSYLEVFTHLFIHHHEDVVNALQESSAQHLRHAPEAFREILGG